MEEDKNKKQKPSDGNDDQPVTTPAPAEVPTPTEVSTPAPASEPQVNPAPEPAAELTLDQKLEEARRAMEGPDKTAERLGDEKNKEIKQLLSEIQGEIEKVSKEKELLELAWIDLNGKRKAMKEEVAPIITEEKKLEGQEIILEDSEAKTAMPKIKHEVEEKRWGIQQQRRQKEEEKWGIEQQIVKLDEEIKVNTDKYQKLLDAEEGLRDKLETLERELPA